MPPTEPLDIKVIYSASGRPARAVRVAAAAKPKAVATPATRTAPARTAVVRAPVSERRVLMLGVLNLTVALVMLWAVWWPVDSFIYQKFVYKTPVDISQLGPMFGMTPQQLAETTAGDPSLPAADEPTITGTTAQMVIAASGYGWLTLSTLAGYTLALAAGTAFGQLFSAAWRRYAAIIFMGVILGLAVAGVDTWQKFQTRFPMDYLRWGMLIGGIAFLIFGMMFSRGALRWSRVGAVLTIVAAVASVAGLILGKLCGAIPPEQSAALFLALVFVAHSLYGWLLWFLSPRLAA